MEIYQAVGQNIHRIRKAQQLSIDRAAALSGVSKSMLGQIERGLVNPTVSAVSYTHLSSTPSRSISITCFIAVMICSFSPLSS